ncbi:hypothetical protein FDP41_011371 [Naegleria fowleri]|uniref:Ras-GEF domain-containing protein n=1 Tax=Naegleria fowleri TaxID=5763 RepID=A0A6A5C5T2_NAEFO|nr:uncharacterized protein FDP41_011371 [Naegleria fowleri]KAF0982441.1 hypothetical protein FDP41_011371 [Naegleria fowleri]
MPSSSVSGGSSLLGGGERIVMEGEVLRRSLFSTWRKMYMLLKDDGSLHQFGRNPQLYPEETLKETLMMNSGYVIQIVNADSLLNQQFTIMILFNDKAPMLLKAKDSVEHQRWLSALNRLSLIKNEKFRSTNQLIIDAIEIIPIPCIVSDKNRIVQSLNFPCQSITGLKKEDIKNISLANMIRIEGAQSKTGSTTLGAVPKEAHITTSDKFKKILMLSSQIETQGHILVFLHDINEYDAYLDEELEEVFDELYQAQMNGPKESIGGNETKTMRLFVKISGMSPFVLRLYFGLQTHHYQKIVDMYYSDKLYNKKPPGPIFLQKIINFPNGDKMMEFGRKQVASDRFSMEEQIKLAIYDEPEASEDSIVMQKCSVPEMFNGDVPKVIGINRLLLLLTDVYSPKYLTDVFWYTFRYSMKPKVVLEKIYQRYFVPEPSDQDLIFNDVEKTYFTTFVCTGIKKKCLNLILMFVKSGMFDFDNEMVIHLQEFLNKAEQSLNNNGESVKPVTNLDFGLSSTINHIREMLNKQDRKQPWQKAKDMTTLFQLRENKKAKFAGATNTQSLLDISEMSPKEIADQLTYMDYTIYNEIYFTEILDQAWNKDKRRHQAPNVMANINFLNKVSTWFTWKILSEDAHLKRVKMLKKVIQVLGILKDMNSFNMLMAIMGVLGGTSIHRLSNLWEEMDEKTLEIQQQCAELASTKGNNKNFRMAMNECYSSGKLSSPYIGIYLRDLVFTDDGNPTIMDGKINFSKCINTYNVMHQILRFQGRPFDIEPNTDFIREMVAFNDKEKSEDYLYELSLQVQPRK